MNKNVLVTLNARNTNVSPPKTNLHTFHSMISLTFQCTFEDMTIKKMITKDKKCLDA